MILVLPFENWNVQNHETVYDWGVSTCSVLTSVLLLLFSPSQFYVHNHLSFILYCHKEKLEQGEMLDYRVVRFEVVPQSVKVDGRCLHTLWGAWGRLYTQVPIKKVFVLRSEGCGKGQDVHPAWGQQLRPPGDWPDQGERGPVYLLCPLGGQLLLFGFFGTLHILLKCLVLSSQQYLWNTFV